MPSRLETAEPGASIRSRVTAAGKMSGGTVSTCRIGMVTAIRPAAEGSARRTDGPDRDTDRRSVRERGRRRGLLGWIATEGRLRPAPSPNRERRRTVLSQRPGADGPARRRDHGYERFSPRCADACHSPAPRHIRGSARAWWRRRADDRQVRRCAELVHHLGAWPDTSHQGREADDLLDILCTAWADPRSATPKPVSHQPIVCSGRQRRG